MEYTVTVTSSRASIRYTCNHIAGALDLVQRISHNSVNSFELLTDVAQLGEWLECVGNVWYRVVACRLH